MAFSDVAFAFKQIITSAKLNQLMENIRTHDHISVGQGDKFGRIGGAGTGTNVTDSSTNFVPVVSASVVIPAGATPSRRLQFPVFVRAEQSSGTAIGNIRAGIFENDALIYDLGILPIPNVGPNYAFSFTVFNVGVPAAGTYTYSLRLQNVATGTSWTSFQAAVDVMIV